MILREQDQKRSLLARREQEMMSSVASRETKTVEWEAILKTVSDVFDEDPNDDEEAEVEFDGELEKVKIGDDAENKTVKLAVVREALEKSWNRDPIERFEATEFKANITNKIADACRQEKWRLPVGNSGILQFYIKSISGRGKVLEEPVIPFLRLVGNSCADTIENRARVVKADILKLFISASSSRNWRPYVMAVLFNLCVDYEPAQKQAIERGLILELLNLLSDYEPADANAFSSVPRLLALLAHDDLAEDEAPSATPIQLLDFAMSSNIATDEDLLAFTTVAIQFLTKERFRKFAVSEHGISSMLKVLDQLHIRDKDLDKDEAQAIDKSRKALSDILADISDNPSFVSLVLEENSSVAATLRSWLTSSQTQLQVCACLTLGNVARSDKVCILLVEEWKIQCQLVEILKTANDSQLLHAAIGFLKNLALPLSNKNTLGEAGFLELLPRIWKMDVAQQVQFSGVTLARQLIINTPTNVSRLLDVSPGPVTSSSATPATSENNIDILAKLFLKSDIEPTKTEISRLLLTVCRVLSMPSTTSSPTPKTSSEDLDTLQNSFFSQKEVLRASLSYLAKQQKWPALRSEAFFVYALTARTQLGSSLIASIILSSEVLPVIQQTLSPSADDQLPLIKEQTTDVLAQSNDLLSELMAAEGGGKKLEAEEGKGKAKEEMMRVDKMNVLVLITEVLKNADEHLGVEEREKLEELIRAGSKNL